MKCKCGNELFKPRVKPYPVEFMDVVTRKPVFLLFNAGFVTIGEETSCYFCAISVRGSGGES